MSNPNQPLGVGFKRPVYEITVPSNAGPGTPRVIIGARVVPPELIADGIDSVAFRIYGTGTQYWFTGVDGNLLVNGVSDGVSVLRVESEDIDVSALGAHRWLQGFLNFEGSLKGIAFNDPPVEIKSNLRVKEGANKIMGVATLVAGTVVVNNTAVAANSRIFLTIETPGGVVGAVYVAARVAGTSFTITSTSGADTSTVAWLLIAPT